MKITPEERAAFRASFHEMSLRDKLDHIWTYYRLRILLVLAVLAAVGYTGYRWLTDRDPYLYVGFANVAVGEDLEARITDDFISAAGEDPRKTEVSLYRGLYLSDDPSQENHQYGYASKLKVMAAIESKQLDVVLMNREAYDILSQSGYLMELSELLSGETALEPYLTANTVILEDNAIEVDLNEADQYIAVTEDAVNAVEVTQLPLFSQAGFPDNVYLGVIANSPRLSVVTRYMEYLADPQS